MRKKEQEKKDVCPRCHGEGRIDYENISGHDYTLTCNLCRGTGRYKTNKEAEKWQR